MTSYQEPVFPRASSLKCVKTRNPTLETPLKPISSPSPSTLSVVKTPLKRRLSRPVKTCCRGHHLGARRPQDARSSLSTPSSALRARNYHLKTPVTPIPPPSTLETSMKTAKWSHTVNSPSNLDLRHLDRLRCHFKYPLRHSSSQVFDTSTQVNIQAHTVLSSLITTSVPSGSHVVREARSSDFPTLNALAGACRGPLYFYCGPVF